MSPQASYPIYSEDLWDYLEDMKRMPSRRDRDKLVANARADTAEGKRVQLWDYFFRIRPEDVGLPLRRERAAVHAQLVELRGRVAEIVERGQRTAAALRAQLAAFDTEQHEKYGHLQEDLRRELTAKAKRTLANALAAMVPVGVYIAGLLFMTVAAQGGSDAVDGCLSVVAGTFWFTCGGLVAIPLVVAGGVMLWRGLNDMSSARQEAAIAAATNSFVVWWRQSHDAFVSAISEQERDVTEAQALLASHEPGWVGRIEVLDQQLGRLLSQLPPIATVKQVEEWFQEDLEWLEDRALERCNLREPELERLVDTKNPACILGPGVLQRSDLIPPSYQVRDSDRAKHLSALQLVDVGDVFYDHYGVYNLQFLLFAKETLASYNVFYDFIKNEPLGDQARILHYGDVTGIDSTTSFRQVPSPTADVEDVTAPSLSLALPGADRIEITFAGEEFHRSRGARQIKVKNYDPLKAAESARRNVASRVEAAKKRREVPRAGDKRDPSASKAPE